MEVTGVDILRLLKDTLLGDEAVLPDQKETKRKCIDITILAAKYFIYLFILFTIIQKSVLPL